MKITAISYTEHPIDVMYVAAKNCTSRYSLSKLNEMAFNQNNSLLESDKIHLVNSVIDSGHTSIAEHVSFTIAIEGISRSCSHQLVRHRLASYAQKSQRYVSESKFDYVIPQCLYGKYNEIEGYNEFMEIAQKFYNGLIEHGIPKEDARYVLPNACCTDIVITMNLRAFMNFYELRACGRAQWEIRQLAKAVYRELKTLDEQWEDAMGLVELRCEKLGYCPELKSCGKFNNKS